MKLNAVAVSVLIAAAAAALAGCGQKSALYLPGHNPHPPKPMIQPAKHNNADADSKTANGNRGAPPS